MEKDEISLVQQRSGGRDAEVTIIGGGLAGSEAAWQLARRGIRVKLFEMRPVQRTEAHHTEWLAELVCSNSFRSASLDAAVGLLKEEMRLLGSLVMRVADRTKVIMAAITAAGFVAGMFLRMSRGPKPM